MKEAEKYHVGGVLKTDKGTIIYNLNGVKKAKMTFLTKPSQDSLEDADVYEDLSNLELDASSLE
jgi:hypothetical protein